VSSPAGRIMDRILTTLAQHPGGLRSTDIGLALGRSRYDATAYVGQALNKLRQAGAVRREYGEWVATGKPAPKRQREK
jgi:hypothetical protein